MTLLRFVFVPWERPHSLEWLPRQQDSQKLRLLLHLCQPVLSFDLPVLLSSCPPVLLSSFNVILLSFCSSFLLSFCPQLLQLSCNFAAVLLSLLLAPLSFSPTFRPPATVLLVLSSFSCRPYPVFLHLYSLSYLPAPGLLCMSNNPCPSYPVYMFLSWLTTS